MCFHSSERFSKSHCFKTFIQFMIKYHVAFLIFRNSQPEIQFVPFHHHLDIITYIDFIKNFFSVKIIWFQFQKVLQRYVQCCNIFIFTFFISYNVSFQATGRDPYVYLGVMPLFFFRFLILVVVGLHASRAEQRADGLA